MPMIKQRGRSINPVAKAVSGRDAASPGARDKTALTDLIAAAVGRERKEMRRKDMQSACLNENLFPILLPMPT